MQNYQRKLRLTARELEKRGSLRTLEMFNSKFQRNLANQTKPLDRKFKFFTEYMISVIQKNKLREFSVTVNIFL